jgi:hypothetical protein
MKNTRKASFLIVFGLILALAAPSAALAGRGEGRSAATMTLNGDPHQRAVYDLRLVVPPNPRRSFGHEETVRISVTFGPDGTAELDLSQLVERIPDWNPEFDTIEIQEETPVDESSADSHSVDIMQNVSLNSGGGASSTYHIRRDVAGPDFNGLGNNAEDFTVDHHAFIVENTRSSTDETDGTSINTGGIAIVLHSDGNDHLSLFDLDAYDFNDHVLNTINRNDHFLTFFREDADGTQDIVGRVEGLSFWDMGEINQEIVDFFAQSGHLPWNWLDLNVTFNDPDTWLQWTPPSLTHPNFVAPSLSGGSLPYFAYNNTSCENNADEVCLRLGSINVLGNSYNLGEVDTTFRRGSWPTLNPGSFDQPLAGLQFDPGSLSATPPIEFGSPFLQADGAAVNAFANDLENTLGSIAPIAFEMKTNPVGFAAKYLFALRGGVTYESGSGDYAEWLERLDPDEQLRAGEIVGVHGGKVTRNTEGADQTMVVSYKPIVLGNMPAAERQSAFEKVAFMGQTLVKVVGHVNKGDYILPSGKHDGLGIAIAPDTIRVDQLSSVVGIAWGAGGTPGRLGLVNVAVGLRPVEFTRVIADQQATLDDLREQYTSAKLEIARLQAELETMQAALGGLEELRTQVESLLQARVARNAR